MLYDLTYKRNLMNKINYQAKPNLRHGNGIDWQLLLEREEGENGGNKGKGLVRMTKGCGHGLWEWGMW